MMHGWQSESTDGRKGGWRVVAMVACVVTSPTTAGCSVMQCSCSCSVVEL